MCTDHHSNEGRACEAVVQQLEMRTGCIRADVRFPERDHSGPPVDVELMLGNQRFAIEHTELQTFGGQNYSAALFAELMQGVLEELAGRLPGPGVYQLVLPTVPRVGRSTDLVRARSALIEWILRTAHGFPVRQAEAQTRNLNPRGHFDTVTERPAGLPFEVTLSRQISWAISPEHSGRLTYVRLAPPDYSEQQREQVSRALDRKCPKLADCKMAGARTVLVLEDNDLSLSNHASIENAFRQSSKGRADLPDEVFLVSTVVDVWSIWQLKHERRIGLQRDRVDLNSSCLRDLTGY